VTFVLIILGFAAGLVLVILKALAVDQVRGQIQRRITASVEATIASLPDELQAEYAEDWRAELAAVKSMPITAARLARGLRQSATELIGEPTLAPAGTRRQTRDLVRDRRALLTVAGWLLVVWAVVKRPLLSVPIAVSVSTAAYVGLVVWLGGHDALALASYALIALALWRLVHRRSFQRVVGGRRRR
jgi:hypothetical protein